ncbi:hypothetical protein AU468_07540 [Alkalispirochaeta sphaeroplastigenens]|uniref:DNA repair protein RecO n=1 Tax=Alkalispirochaeta sphaeroplastigenens TaxID=1187066 RepID=A0A2S4JQI3_9SPIO|nr:hypothetical protein AU468_07540 [Alkalispirochaeta sphaeroplastigenens]
MRIAPVGESHGAVDFLSPREGLLRGMAYGLRSRKSSLRGRVLPFARGTIYLYRDPRRDTAKITDFDGSFYPSFQEDLTAYSHGSLWAEVVWKTFASGGEGQEVFDLLARGYALLEKGVRHRELPTREIPAGRPGPAKSSGAGTPAEATASPRAAVQLLSMLLLWRYLTCLGVRPPLEICAASDQAIAPGEDRFYDRLEGTILCRERVQPGQTNVLPLPSGTARLLMASEQVSLERASQFPVTARTLDATRRFVTAAVQDTLQYPLKTLQAAASLL